jgi:tagatose 1,6-diphosphate aldolase
VGYGVRARLPGPPFRGTGAPVVAAIGPPARLSELWITCNPENVASRRTCEFAGAEFVEIVDLPPHVDMYREGERRKRRYRLDLQRIPIPCDDP